MGYSAYLKPRQEAISDFSNNRALRADGRLLFGKTWNNMPAPAQNIFHGIKKTAPFDQKYTIPEKRI